MPPLTGSHVGHGPPRPDGLPPLAAAALAAGAVALTALVSKRYSPTPDHPDVERWYRQLEKPGFTPPDPVMGLGWGVTETLLAIGGYRLMRLPSGTERNLALALWALNFATIAGWAKLFFGDRDLDGSLADVAAASRVDGPAAALGVPYAAWTAFGSALDEEVWRLNRGRMASAPTEAPSSARRSPRSGCHDATSGGGARLPSPHVQ